MFKHLSLSLLILLAGLAVLPVQAGTIDEIARLEQGKGTDNAAVQAPSPGQPPASPARAAVAPQAAPASASTAPGGPVWFHLSDGRSLDIRHWQVVHFMRSDCPHCHNFNPVLNDVATQTGLKVFVYSFDGLGDAVFPRVLPVNDGVLRDFFAEMPQVTPTDFLVNTQSLVTIPLSQGEMTADAFRQRLDESFALADRLGVL